MMEYVEVGRDEQVPPGTVTGHSERRALRRGRDGRDSGKEEDALRKDGGGQAGAKVPGAAGARGHGLGHPAEHGDVALGTDTSMPVYLEEGEELLDHRKPQFWAYGPSVFGMAFGVVLLALFAAGGGIVGFLIGAGILGSIIWAVRSRLYPKAGYWFTDRKIVVHDGNRVMLLPYDEIALSTLSFEGNNCMFRTIHGQEVVMKGVEDMDKVVAFIGKRVREERRTGGDN